jgi:hypothetical protein
MIIAEAVYTSNLKSSVVGDKHNKTPHRQCTDTPTRQVTQGSAGRQTDTNQRGLGYRPW